MRSNIAEKFHQFRREIFSQGNFEEARFGQKIFSSGGGECRRTYFVYVQGAKRRITEKDLSKKEVTLDCRSINFPTLNTAKGYFSETLVSNINLTSLSSDFIYIFIGYHPFWL